MLFFLVSVYFGSDYGACLIESNVGVLLEAFFPALWSNATFSIIESLNYS